MCSSHFTVKYQSHLILFIKRSMRLIEHTIFISKIREFEISRRNIDIIRSCTYVYETIIAVRSKVLRFSLLIANMYSKVEQHVIRRIARHIRSTRRFSVNNVQSMLNSYQSETSGSDFKFYTQSQLHKCIRMIK